MTDKVKAARKKNWEKMRSHNILPVEITLRSDAAYLVMVIIFLYILLVNEWCKTVVYALSEYNLLLRPPAIQYEESKLSD